MSQLRLLLLVLSVWALSGCVSVPIPIGRSSPDKGIEWVDSAEVATLKSLYNYDATLLELDSERREAQYLVLNAIGVQQRSPVQRVRLALLLGGVEPTLTDYSRAVQELQRAALALEGQELLQVYVRSKIQQYDSIDKIKKALVISQGKNRQLQRRSRRDRQQFVQNRNHNTLADVEDEDENGIAALDVTDNSRAVAVQEQEQALNPLDPSVSGARGLAEAEWNAYSQQLLTELQLTRQELEEKNNKIAIQNNEIGVLEAKIKALSAIESNLNQREE